MAKVNPKDPKGNDRSALSNGARNWEWNGTGDLGDRVQWSDVDAEAIRATIQAAASVGAAVLFTTSSDGGVLTIMVLDGQKKPKFYAKTAEEAEILLARIENTFSAL